jgi:hypothetical protein
MTSHRRLSAILRHKTLNHLSQTDRYSLTLRTNGKNTV